VAEHILQTLYVSYVLCKLHPAVDEVRILKMCLVHDLPEARTGDMNYVNKKYVTVHEDKAVQELTESLPFGQEIAALLAEFNAQVTEEAKIARDADQLALIIKLKECGDLGNKYSDEWIDYAQKRLVTTVGKELAQDILETDSSHWWFKDKGDWWVNGAGSHAGRSPGRADD